MNETERALPELRERLGQAFAALRQGNPMEAARVCEALLAAHPDHPEVRYLASEIGLARDDLDAALSHIEAANAAAPGQAPLLLKQARILLGQRRRLEAREVALGAADAAAQDWRTLWAVGQFFIACHDPATAGRIYQRARDAGASDPNLLYDLASAAFFSGDFEAAENHLDELLQALPDSGHALHLRSTLRRQTPERNHIEELEARLQQGLANDAARAGCLYALAKEHEDLGDHQAAFAALTRGASLHRRSLNYDVKAECAALDSIRAAWQAAVCAPQAGASEESGAIFIVGLPRTGTTLVERMLGRHPQVRSVGELMDFAQLLGAGMRQLTPAPDQSMAQLALSIDYAALGRDYLRGARELADGRPFLVDKMPANFMYCGPIHRALPKARIIHLVRDPMDACYAVYKTLFYQAYHYSYELRELADYYLAYHRLMAHWHEVMPGVILDLRYEDLVSDLGGQARRMLDYCGLEWDSAVLTPDADPRPSTTASAAQVREPVHDRSVGRWRLHADGLAPLRERLVAGGIQIAD